MLLEHFWWGSVFLVNVPIIALALVAGYVLLPKSRDPEPRRRSTRSAPLLSIVGLSALVYAIIEAPNHGWVERRRRWPGSPARVAAARVFGLWELAHPAPDARPAAVPRPPLRVSSGGITLVFFAMFGTFFLFSQYLQFVLGYSPLGRPCGCCRSRSVMMTVAPQTPKLVARFGANRVAATGLVLVAVGLTRGAATSADSALPGRCVVTAVFLSSGMAMTMSPMTDPADVGRAAATGPASARR